MRWMLRLLLGVVTVTACQSEDAGDWKVTLEGYGPIHAGMTLEEAAAAGGRPFGDPQLGSEECDYVFFADDTVSGRVLFMVIDGRIARVDIQDSAVTTSHGARIGDSEEWVKKLYPGRVTVQPHKYTEGHYLVIAPAAPVDSGLGLIFETEGGKVTTYRAGRVPEVEYVEGCS